MPRRVPQDLGEILTLKDDRSDRHGMRLYYGVGAISDTATLDDFLATGGVLVNQWKSDGQTAQTVFDSVGKRAVPVAVGPYQAAMVHGDEIQTKIRPFGLYWSDGTRDFSVLAGVDRPETVIDLARSIYCP